MSGQHAFFPPSGAAETVACALWPTMVAAYPQPETDDTREGEAAHWAAAELYHQRPVDVGQIAPNGVMLTEEVIDSAEAMAAALHGDDWTVERPVGDRNSLNWGTPDARRIRHLALSIKDLKHGFKPVDAYEWWQGINYAKLIAETYQLAPETVVDFEVIQPRDYSARGPKTWVTTLAELQPYFDRLDAAHAAALAPVPVASTGPQCDYCPGRHACPALQTSALRIAHHRAESLPMEMSDEAAGREAVTLRRSIKLLQARLTGLEADIETRINAGRVVAHHAVVPDEGREAWTVDAEQVLSLGALMGVDLAKPGLKTPGQARKAGMPGAVVAQFSRRPTVHRLVEDDGRAASKLFDGTFKVS